MTTEVNEVIENMAKQERIKAQAYRTEYKMDSKDRLYETRKGYRSNGPRKDRLINQANLILAELGGKGVNILFLLKILGITGDAVTMTTKQWTGVISKLKTFRKENGL
jgi:hypothetical protein